jgi:hypothetical protein
MKKKAIISAVAGVIIVLVGIIIFLLVKGHFPADTKEKTTLKNETGVTVEQASISFANMKLDNDKLHLTDEQKEVLKYFDNDYFRVYSYEDLQRYPDVYKGAQIEIGAVVEKIIKSTDNEYELLVKTTGPFSMEDWGVNVDLPDDYAVIKGKQTSKRIIEGDRLNVYGSYKSIDTYTVDGKSYTVPTINVYNVTTDDKRFDLDTIKKVATYIFGPDIKLSNPNKDSMVTWFYSYLVTLDNQSNDNFKSFVFSQESGFVSDLRNFGDDSYGSRLLYIAADLEHYLITVYDKDTKIMNLEYYDKDLKKLWSREFEDVTDFPMDYTSDEIMLVADNDLYVINTKDGKDKIEPTFVGEKVRVIMADDGAILISKTKKDLVTKIDKKGKIVWSIDAKYSILNNSDDAYYDSANNNINGLQVINGNYVLSYNGDDGSQKDENEYNFGVGTCYLVFDKEGNIILEELEEKKTDNGNDEEAYTENYDDYDEENY